MPGADFEAVSSLTLIRMNTKKTRFRNTISIYNINVGGYKSVRAL